MPSIFMSYRRNDSLESTGRIYDRLVQRFGGDCVFRDIDSIPIGLPFPTVLRDTLARTDAVLAIIGPTWLSAGLEDGCRRIDDPDDFVRMEIATALENGLPLIPVTVGNACLPKQTELPNAIRGLVLQNGVAVRPDPDFHHDMDRLVSKLEGVTDRNFNPRRLMAARHSPSDSRTPPRPRTSGHGDARNVAFPLSGQSRHAEVVISELNSWPA